MTQPRVAPHFMSPEAWAQANSIGISIVRESLRRAEDPLPHLRIGRKYLVDDEPAVAWWRRKYGVGAQ